MKRLYPDQPVVGIGVVIVNKGKLLLAKRGNEPGKGKWANPGGLVELGESILTTVIREAKEETSLEVADPKLVDVVDTTTIDEDGKVKYHYVIVDYFVKVVNGAVKAESDVVELHWVPFEEVENYVLTASFREFFVKNRSKLEQLDSYL
ncbi:MAG: NUDIX hydrolase [Candidatus Bathyarchaeia archaeon]|jgi:ADP-ribose pyrophosphatase YjhB (NUDIX family)